METKEKVEIAAKAFDMFGPAIYTLISLTVSNKSDVDDIYQDLFLSLVRKPIPSLTPKSMGYFWKAVRNHIIDRVRREESHRNRISMYTASRGHSTVQEDPENIAIRAEQIQKLIQLIETRLPRHEAQAIIKRYCENRELSDAAKERHINKRSLSRYLCTGLKKIRQFTRQNGGIMDSSFFQL
jgi:RNA polymerase sigma factor (sigma-70 family)